MIFLLAHPIVVAQLAMELRLPVIDLSRTFDPTDKRHYGSTPIEPSNTSGQFIADLIAKVGRVECRCRRREVKVRVRLGKVGVRKKEVREAVRGCASHFAPQLCSRQQKLKGGVVTLNGIRPQRDQAINMTINVKQP